MIVNAQPWDYLILTSSNDSQARSYQSQLDIRRQLGLLSNVREVLVIADPEGKRIGSGASTLWCLMEVLDREIAKRGGGLSVDDFQGILSGLRILIIHAGGDSRRLPAYGPCGKIFMPVVGENDTSLPVTLFDRQFPVYSALPCAPDGLGQVVITSGDVMLRFDPTEVVLDGLGLTGLGCYATSDHAENHGVFCVGDEGGVDIYLQKPSLSQQEQMGVLDGYGRAVLDIGVMNFDAETAVKLLKLFGAESESGGRFGFAGEFADVIFSQSLDFYREICCAMGRGVTLSQYIDSARQGGSKWDESLLERVFGAISDVPFGVEVLGQCDFVDFGTTQHIIQSGMGLLKFDRGVSGLRNCLDINNHISDQGQLAGVDSWVEGCRVNSSLTVEADNLVVGVDVDSPLSLPARACLDVVSGRDRDGDDVRFVRCYGVDDRFKDTVAQGATFCNMAIMDWLGSVGAADEDVWDGGVASDCRRVWDAKVFPAIKGDVKYCDWVWMFDPDKAEAGDYQRWLEADRYSFSEIAGLVDYEEYYRRRLKIRFENIRGSVRKMFSRESGFSANELADIFRNTSDLSVWVAALIEEAKWHWSSRSADLGSLIFPRVIHTLGSALEEVCSDANVSVSKAFGQLHEHLSCDQLDWLAGIGLGLDSKMTIGEWASRAKSAAFEHLGKSILSSTAKSGDFPKSVLRSDEIVWGRAPARFDTGGGWTDTPPYSLEYGGCVIDTAVDLNGQSPIQAYARVIEEPVIRISSIDLGTRIEISCLDDLMDYRDARSEYGLAKCALALSGLSTDSAGWADGITLPKMLERFGGGIELTTLAAIPKGSGLGTSSIMGAVILAVIQRVMGRALTQKELFNGVLQLEQSLTTGGGWQDQIGGAVGGVKIVTAEPALVPDARIHYLPPDLIDPRLNDGQTLLYYTGITRLAKNILEQVVGRVLNRDRQAMSTLEAIYSLAREIAETLSRKDMAAYGRLVRMAWELNKQLDPNSTNPAVEELMARVDPYIYGAKLLGAGGGGFMLMVCKSAADAMRIRTMLDNEPPNARARFFDYSVNTKGLVVTVS